MNNIIADKLTEAFNNKKNDVNSFVWRGPRKYINNERVQEEIKLMDATPEQLKKWYHHCESMLYSNDKDNPGRYTLLKIIRDQRNRCNAELYIRELRNPSTPDQQAYPTHIFYQDLRDYLEQVKDQVPQSRWDEIPIGAVMNTIQDYRNIPINVVLDACLSNLGRFRKNHITLNFLTNMGLWFTKQEIKDYLTKTDDNGKPVDKLEVVRQNLYLRPNVNLKINNKGGLSYLEFRAMYNLHDMLYSEMTNIQLTTLRNKVLFRLENEARNHAKLWEEKIDQIQKVCDARGITLE